MALRAPAHPAAPEPWGTGVHEPSTGGSQARRLGDPDGVVPVTGADTGVSDLVQDGLAYLRLVVQAHEMTTEGESASGVVRLTGSTACPVEGQLPVTDVGLLHEGASQGQDVGKIHGPTLCAGGPASLTALVVILRGIGEGFCRAPAIPGSPVNPAVV